MTDYVFNEEQAAKADDIANRIDTSGAYVGKFLRAEATVSQSGTEGIVFEFDGGSSGRGEFTLWTRKEDGSTAFGMNFLQSIMLMLGLRGLKSAPGKVMKWSDDANARVEEDGEVFPDLVGRSIGIVLQKELTTKRSGGDSYRLNLYGVFHHESRLTASEIKERKTTPMKLDKLLKGLKDKDSRKASAEPTQPSMTAAGGGF